MKPKLVLGGTDCDHPAGGNLDAGSRTYSAGGDQRADVVSLEETVYRLEVD